jgi:hypothetical protein
VNVSGAKLLAIHLTPLTTLQTGQSVVMKATADFEDEKGVQIHDANYLTLQSESMAGMGYIGGTALRLNDASDTVFAQGVGATLLSVSHIGVRGAVEQQTGLR